MTKLPERDPLLTEVSRLLGRQNSLAAVARKSGVSESCLRAWRAGRTRRPQHLTVKFALRACGYDLRVVKDE